MHGGRGLAGLVTADVRDVHPGPVGHDLLGEALLPAHGAEVRGRLERLGIFRVSGHEHFAGSLVIPVLGVSR